jgi:hypothetical protein
MRFVRVAFSPGLHAFRRRDCPSARLVTSAATARLRSVSVA